MMFKLLVCRFSKLYAIISNAISFYSVQTLPLSLRQNGRLWRTLTLSCGARKIKWSWIFQYNWQILWTSRQKGNSSGKGTQVTVKIFLLHIKAKWNEGYAYQSYFLVRWIKCTFYEYFLSGYLDILWYIVDDFKWKMKTVCHFYFTQ